MGEQKLQKGIYYFQFFQDLIFAFSRTERTDGHIWIPFREMCIWFCFGADLIHWCSFAFGFLGD
jgi:hypothetical protein